MKLLKILAAVFSVVVLMTLSACGPKYPDCGSDKDCKDKGEFCFDKKCVKCVNKSQCAQMGPCGYCNASKECARPKGMSGDCCSLDQDCQQGKCWKLPGADTGTCAQCLGEADCGPNMKCVQGNCVPNVECSGDADCGAGKKCENGKCVIALCEAKPVYFDFDEYAIRADARTALNNTYSCIKERGITSISIEGNCDERGSDEYNLALGNRRANAAKKFLKGLGMKDKQMSTVSYGEERPACMSTGESCWTQNRRDEIKFK